MDPAFLELCSRTDERIDPAEGALLISRQAYPRLRVDSWKAKLAKLGAAAAKYVGPVPRGSVDLLAVRRLNEYLFGRLGFHGNDDDYHDPRNSYLNEVLERRLGLPITLAIVYRHAARAAGLPAEGIGLPGRFLAGFPGAGILVDCFDGRLVDRADCQALLDSLYGGRLSLTEEMLRPWGGRETLRRVLNNLKGAHLARGDFRRVESVLEYSEALDPGHPDHLRDRGMLLIQREQFGGAVALLEEYLRRVPDAPDAAAIRRNVALTRRLLAHLN